MNIDGFEARYFAAVTAMGMQIRAARLRLGLSQEQVAIRAGIALHTYRSLEQGRGMEGGAVKPKLDTLARVFEALGIIPPPLE